VSRAPVEQPTETPTSLGGDRGVELSHPAYALISASRFSASPGVTLHGSDFRHQHAVALTITKSVVGRDLSHDWHHPRGIPYIEVFMSESQWATFVSSMNVGGGVPCTVKHVNGRDVPTLPPRDTRASFDREMAERLEKMAARVASTISTVEADLASLSGKKRESALGHLRSLKQEIESNLPYVAKQFDEHMERTVEKAKTEVAAYIHSEVSRAGLAALNGTTPLALTSGEESK
jgi:hypothetical protein